MYPNRPFPPGRVEDITGEWCCSECHSKRPYCPECGGPCKFGDG